MYISAISSAYSANNKYPQQQFKSLIVDKSAAPIIRNMSKTDIWELEQIDKRLSKTKFWDMKISCIKNKYKEFKFEFIDKKNKHGIITNGIHPYYKKGNTIGVYSIIYGPENISNNVIGTLKYRSADRADIVYEKYLKNIEEVRYRHYNLTPIESLKSKEIELNMLEEASHFAEESDNLTYLSSKLLKDETGNGYKPSM